MSKANNPTSPTALTQQYYGISGFFVFVPPSQYFSKTEF
jgi:hypothetical protein